jgi:hypothetical protein
MVYACVYVFGECMYVCTYMVYVWVYVLRIWCMRFHLSSAAACLVAPIIHIRAIYTFYTHIFKAWRVYLLSGAADIGYRSTKLVVHKKEVDSVC